MPRNSPYRLLPEICRANSAMFTQKSEPKESAEVSKSLVGGGSVERDEMVAERRGVAVWQCVAALALIALAAWLLGLTLVREVQLARVRGELHDLRGELQALGARVHALDKYVEAEKNLVNDLNAYEDEVVADLDSITVLDDSGDAEYEEEGEDGESGEGSMYEQYDQMRQQTRPADRAAALGAVMHAPPPRDASAAPRGAALAELRRIVRPQPPPPAASGGVRSRRSVRMQPALTSRDPMDAFAAPRLLASKIDDSHRRKSKKYDPEGMLQAGVAPRAPHDLPRRTRDSDDELAAEERVGGVRTRRSFVAAHFHGNTSHLNVDIHPHYRGNGLVRLEHGEAHNVWAEGDWTRMRAPTSATSPALTRRGHVHVKRTGVYFVYVQIYYVDAHDTTGWVLHRTAADAEGGAGEREALLQCASTSPSTEPIDKSNSCFSAAALLLREGDRLAVRNTGGDRHSVMQPEKSFIGLVKLADADDDEYTY